MGGVAPPGGAAAGVARRGREGDAGGRGRAAGAGRAPLGAPPGDGAGAGTPAGVPAGRGQVVAACVCGMCALCACVCGVRGRGGLTVRGYAECPRSGTRHTPFF